MSRLEIDRENDQWQRSREIWDERMDGQVVIQMIWERVSMENGRMIDRILAFGIFA